MTEKSKKHISRVAQLPCCVTGQHGVQVHHVIGRDMKGMGQRSSDWFAIPLAPEIHDELHRHGWREWERKYGSQIDHVAKTLRALYG